MHPALTSDATPLLQIEGVTITYGRTAAVRDVSLMVAPGETLGLIGESGSGKSSLARLVVGLVRPAAGRDSFDGRDTAAFDRAAGPQIRRDPHRIFQDTGGALSPPQPIGRTLAEPLAIHGVDRAKAWPDVLALLHRVGLSDGILGKYPQQVSGGQARRVGIARALLLRPRLIVADEPTAGLDLSVQGDLVNLMTELQRDFGLAYLVISHNLPLVRAMADRLAVMYLGRLVETGPAREVHANPAHPYTRALIAATPRLDPDRLRPPAPLAGEIPNPAAPPPGCPFQTRCPLADERCRREMPETTALPGGRTVRCHKPLVA